MLTWIQEHLQLIFVVGGAIAYWLNQRKLAREGGEGEARPEEESDPFENPEQAERTRRIRAEIQRKIEERAGGRRPAEEPRSAPELPPIFREILLERPAPPPPVRTGPSALETRRMAEILEQQAALAEQLKQAQEMKALALRRAKFEAEISSQATVARDERNVALAGELRDPVALRRAFILREVLGPPVALRP